MSRLTRFTHPRRLLLVAGLGVWALACGQSAPPPPPPTPTPPPPKTVEQRVQIYEDCWRMFNEKNWDQFQNCYTPDATSTAAGRPAIHGRADIVANGKTDSESFPDRQGELTLVLANGSHIAGVAIWTATNDGPMPGPDGKPIPATHKKAGFMMAHTLEWDPTGSMAASDAAYIDDGTMMAQLGLSKAPARKVMTPTGAAPVVVIAKNDDTESKNIAAFRATADAFNQKDKKTFESMMADNYTAMDVTMPADQNKKAALQASDEYHKAFPDATINATTVWAAGDYVVAVGTFDGTNTGVSAMLGIKKKTDKKISVPFIEIVKFENGKMKDDWTFYNGASFAGQLGLN
jgi:predicted ester cyclase